MEITRFYDKFYARRKAFWETKLNKRGIYWNILSEKIIIIIIIVIS